MYTLLGTALAYDTAGNEQRLFVVRNPWKSENYVGAFCDTCSEWDTYELETGTEWADHSAEDGVFFTPNIDELFGYCNVAIYEDSWYVEKYFHDGKTDGDGKVFEF